MGSLSRRLGRFGAWGVEWDPVRGLTRVTPRRLYTLSNRKDCFFGGTGKRTRALLAADTSRGACWVDW